jgi:hypothetical protein
LRNRKNTVGWVLDVGFWGASLLLLVAGCWLLVAGKLLFHFTFCGFIFYILLCLLLVGWLLCFVVG